MYLITNIFMQYYIKCVCSPCPIAVKRLPAYNLYSNTQRVCTMYMHRRGTSPIAVYKATNCSPHS